MPRSIDMTATARSILVDTISHHIEVLSISKALQELTWTPKLLERKGVTLKDTVHALAVLTDTHADGTARRCPGIHKRRIKAIPTPVLAFLGGCLCVGDLDFSTAQRLNAAQKHLRTLEG